MKKNIVYALTILAVSFSLSACTASELKIKLLEKVGQKVEKVENKINQKIDDEKTEIDDQTLQELNASPSSTIDQDLDQIEIDLK
jgi:hypothetical protein